MPEPDQSPSMKKTLSGGLNAAAGMVGLGKGSTFNPVKAAVVEDSDEEEKTGDSHQIKVKAQVVEDDDDQIHILDKDAMTGNVIQELNEMIDVTDDNAQLNNYMVMDENLGNL